MVFNHTHAERLRDGDKVVFEMIFNDYYGRLCAFARGFVGDQEEAEDIVAEFFVDLWENRKKLDISTSLNSYIYRAVRNRSLNYIKHLAVKDKYKTIVTSHYHDDLRNDKTAEQSESDLKMLQDKINEILENLPPQCKRVFMMSRYEEKKYNEIAEELNISRNAVKKHIVKALDQFRTKLNKDDLLGMMVLFLLWLLAR